MSVFAVIRVLLIFMLLLLTTRVPLVEDEVVLATIKVDSNGVLSCKPDSNKGHKPYKVESGSTRGKG